MGDQSEILHSVRRYVWSGLYDPEDVTVILAESWGLLGQSDKAWLRAEVEKEFAEKRADEATWPPTTDCDPLGRAFAALEAEGIIVEQDASLTKSDGLEIVTQAYEDAQVDGEAAGVVGYCYYHGQDLDHAIANGDLWLAFGEFTDDGERGVEIGRLVQSALRDVGFTTEWSGSVRERILVRGIRWQRRSG